MSYFIKRIIPVFLVLSLIYFYRIYFFNKWDKFQKEEICGLVMSKLRSHNSILFKVNEEEDYKVNYLNLNDSKKISIGDSICKQSNSTSFYVYKKVNDEWVLIKVVKAEF